MKKNKVLTLVVLAVLFFVLLLMHINNIMLFNTNLGFDGGTHKQYISWIQDNHNLPLPHQGWEFNQPPLYYLLASGFDSLGITPQIINLILVFLIAYLILRFSKSKIALLSILALPMINYFPPLITNELIGSFFVIICLLLLLNKPKPILLGILLALGFYSKYTIITLIPLVAVSYFTDEKKSTKAVKNIFISLGLFLLLVSPIIIRNVSLYGKLLPLAPDFYVFESPRQSTGISFFLNLSWIPKLDTFSANKYSFVGGLWNSVWLDSYQVITPVINFSKKALALWLLGFPLTGISVYGLIKIFQKNKRKGIILSTYVTLATFSLVNYYLSLPYDFVLKGFYAFGLVVPYALGLAEASKNKYICVLVVFFLVVQFVVMISSFWIQPWWHVVK